MLRIKPEQMEHFANRARERFVAMMADYLPKSFPDRVAHMNGAALLSWVRRALTVCERYGVIMEPDAAQLMLLLLVLGVDADEQKPWVREALARDVAPVGKVRRLIAGCRERALPIDEMLVVGDFRDPIEET